MTTRAVNTPVLRETDDLIITAKGRVHDQPFRKSSLHRDMKIASNRRRGASGAGKQRSSAKGGFWSHGNRAGTFVASPGRLDRRVVIKSRVVRLNHAVGGSGQVTAKAGENRAKNVNKLHVRYIQRDGVAETGAKGVLFTAQETGIDGADFVERSSLDARQFRFIVSPEDGNDLNLTWYARKLMAQVEQDLGSSLDWIAVNHYNTSHPHTHITVRGVDAQDHELFIHPDYISHGMRSRAAKIATLALGQRSELAVQQGLEAFLQADRVTYLDRKLLSLRDDNGLVHVFPVGQGGAGKSPYVTRLNHLAGIGLASEQAPGQWLVDDQLIEKLRAFKQWREIQSIVGQHIDAPREVRVFDQKDVQQTPVLGVVRGKGVSNELYELNYLVVDGIDGRAHYVKYPALHATPALREGNVVEVGVKPPPPLRSRADENLLALGQGRDTIYRPNAHMQLIQRERLCPPGREAAYLAAHQRRLDTLAARQIVIQQADGNYLLPANMAHRFAVYEAKTRFVLQSEDAHLIQFNEAGYRVYDRAHYRQFALAQKHATVVDIEAHLHRMDQRLQVLADCQLVGHDAQDRFVLPEGLGNRLRHQERQHRGRVRPRLMMRTVGDADLAQTVSVSGPTWLDRLVTAQDQRVASVGFGAEVKSALVDRERWLVQHGLLDPQCPPHEQREALFKRLQEKEFQHLATQLQASQRELVMLKAGERFEGTLTRTVQLRSGRYAEVVRGRHVAYVPMERSLARLMGQAVTVKMNQARRLTVSLKRSLQRGRE